jgi:putative flippase GtrA
MYLADTVLAKLTSRELLTFLAAGGTGYLVDVAVFNLLRSSRVLAGIDPSYARVLAVAAAMVVTYAGNRLVTWRDRRGSDQRREAALFVVFNIVGLVPSVLALVISHDLLGLTSRLADNISANVVGLALGTVVRYWSYRRFVFTAPTTSRPPHRRQDGLTPAP